jgi:hypothetical protein
MWAWETGVYSNDFKARAIAWWRLHRLLETHKQAASIPKRKKG